MYIHVYEIYVYMKYSTNETYLKHMYIQNICVYMKYMYVYYVYTYI